jgi:iron complex transport system substrate-binding protein
MHFRIIDLLEQVGIKTFAIEPRNMSDIFLSINDIGLLTHCIDSADQTILRMKEKLDKAKELFLGKETVSVFWEIWNQPLRTAGPNTFINEAITLAGGKNIFDDVLAAWPEVSVEQVIIRNPQWIMSDESHAANITQEALSQRPLWSGLDAVRNKRIGIINADMIMRGGPRLADAIWQMAELFHGEKNLR